MANSDQKSDSAEISWGEKITGYVGDNVRRLRQERGLTVSQLSEETKAKGYKVLPTSLTNLELKRKATMTIQELLILAEVFNTDINSLMEPPESARVWGIFSMRSEEFNDAAEKVATALAEFISKKYFLKFHPEIHRWSEEEKQEYAEHLETMDLSLWSVLDQAENKIIGEDRGSNGVLRRLMDSDENKDIDIASRFGVIPTDYLVKSGFTIIKEYHERRKASGDK